MTGRESNKTNLYKKFKICIFNFELKLKMSDFDLPPFKPKSAGEKRIYVYLINKFKNNEFKSVRPSFLRNPLTGKNLEYDFYNEDLRLAIEFNGEQHYTYIPFFHETVEKFNDMKDRDKLKIVLSKENNIQLIIVKYDCVNIENYLDLQINTGDVHKKSSFTFTTVKEHKKYDIEFDMKNNNYKIKSIDDKVIIPISFTCGMEMHIFLNIRFKLERDIIYFLNYWEERDLISVKEIKLDNCYYLYNEYKNGKKDGFEFLFYVSDDIPYDKNKPIIFFTINNKDRVLNILSGSFVIYGKKYKNDEIDNNFNTDFGLAFKNGVCECVLSSYYCSGLCSYSYVYKNSKVIDDSYIIQNTTGSVYNTLKVNGNIIKYNNNTQTPYKTIRVNNENINIKLPEVELLYNIVQRKIYDLLCNPRSYMSNEFSLFEFKCNTTPGIFDEKDKSHKYQFYSSTLKLAIEYYSNMYMNYIPEIHLTEDNFDTTFKNEIELKKTISNKYGIHLIQIMYEQCDLDKLKTDITNYILSNVNVKPDEEKPKHKLDKNIICNTITVNHGIYAKYDPETNILKIGKYDHGFKKGYFYKWWMLNQPNLEEEIKNFNENIVLSVSFKVVINGKILLSNKLYTQTNNSYKSDVLDKFIYKHIYFVNGKAFGYYNGKTYHEGKIIS